MRSQKWRVGILLFDDVEVLDFAGPFEVFSVTSTKKEQKPFEVTTVSETGEMVAARNGLRVQPDYSFENAPQFDILVVPGGAGARNREINNERVIQWIANEMKSVRLMTSVCTGALLLAKAGLLENRKCTTHWASLKRLKEEFPGTKVQQGVKFVDEGDIITSGGISAGINMAFHIVGKLLDQEVVQETARRMEYDLC
ncbi:DJ-1/PfpI family protein [Sporolactobacillus pectinivorans]|uniref:DJ-1/PfpI family protein n=1 Tax=Sporolactobacillus pectinivorans TaxID=1591408 RepID=UPI000C26A1CE|nr:DJ-1/PfpI family protein [Sporolactobacillus pectinivorans]